MKTQPTCSKSLLTAPSNKDNRHALSCCTLLLAACGVALSGCSAHQLRADYKGYENAYATSSNRQMLLNLARLHEHHPTYFFKIGQISTSYRMQATATGTGQFAPPNTPTSLVTGGGNPFLLYEKDPVFTFIPVNDDAMSQQLVKPVPATLFYILYQQGWRVDQLFRLMVDHLEAQVPGQPALRVFRNSPAENNFDDYVSFLRVSAVAYELQRRGMLLLQGDTHFEPQAKGFAQPNPPTPKDIWDAQEKQAVWRKTEQGWEIGRDVVIPVFRLNLPKGGEEAAIEALRQRILAEVPEFRTGDPESLPRTLRVLAKGFSIQENYPPANSSGLEEQTVATHLVMRSLIGIMAAAAQEQGPFEELMKENPRFRNEVPLEEQQPLIQLTWKREEQLTPVLVQLDYMGARYEVADRRGPNALHEISWNRDVFRLVSQLASQMTVDISKFPLPEVLQLRTIQ